MRAKRTFDVGRQRGFSLTELVIVLAIVLVLAALAIPNLFRARDLANDAAAEGALRAITHGQVTYIVLYQGYAPSLHALGPPKNGQLPSANAADLIDSQLAAGFKCGYRFHYSVEDLNGDGVVDGYRVRADSSDGTKALLLDHASGVRSRSLVSASGSFKGQSTGEDVPQ